MEGQTCERCSADNSEKMPVDSRYCGVCRYTLSKIAYISYGMLACDSNKTMAGRFLGVSRRWINDMIPKHPELFKFIPGHPENLKYFPHCPKGQKAISPTEIELRRKRAILARKFDDGLNNDKRVKRFIESHLKRFRDTHTYRTMRPSEQKAAEKRYVSKISLPPV